MDAVPILIIGGVAYAVTRKDVPAGLPGMPGALQANFGSTIGQITTGNGYQGGYSWSDYLDSGGQSGFNIDGRSLDPETQQKLDLVQQAAQAQFEKLDYAGRDAAARAMNETLDLDPPLNGGDTWDTVVSVAAGAAGAAACNAIPGVGTAASPLCAIAASYLGVRLEHFLSDSVSAIGSWVSNNVGGAIADVYDAVSDTVSDIGGFIDNIF